MGGISEFWRVLLSIYVCRSQLSAAVRLTAVSTLFVLASQHQVKYLPQAVDGII